MIVIAASAVMLTWYERRRAGLNDGGPEAGEWLATPMMMCVPGAGLTEIKLDATPTSLATQVSQLGVGGIHDHFLWQGAAEDRYKNGLMGWHALRTPFSLA